MAGEEEADLISAHVIYSIISLALGWGRLACSTRLGELASWFWAQGAAVVRVMACFFSGLIFCSFFTLGSLGILIRIGV